MDVYPELAFRAGLLSRGSPLGRLLQAVARGTLHGSDRVIALGETMAERLLEDGARRVTVVHNWADGEAIRPRPVEGHELRRAWNWEDRFVVLYSGNMGLVHEFSTVLDAADRLREEERVRFAFVGDGPRRAWLETEVGRRRLGNVEFRPRVPRERLGQGLTAGDVHLVSMIDGIAGLVVPSKIYGILAAGRPTLYVGPPVGEVAAILREGGCGTHVAIDDGPALAAAVRGYLHDADRRIEEGRRARELFEARFTKRRGLEAHRRALESLTEGPG
jgi:glycosyltransferase involved in cell wall biosynthesis